MELYPLKFNPIYKERLWGGTKLRDLLGKHNSKDGIGESWEISGVESDVSIVSNGKFKGKSIRYICERYKEKLLGKKVFKNFGVTFPILIKFIDAEQDLSIQLHPNNELAQKRHHCSGKTEMWYIMQADKNARLIVGFTKEVTKELYQQHLKNNTLSEILNYEKVQEGDAFFIDTGKIHAIGAGIMLTEIQQTSDITYRIFDFNRKDKDGNLRELHTDLALDAIDYEKKDDFKIRYEKKQNVPNTMASCSYFTTNYLHVKGHLKHNSKDRDSFTIYIVVNGVVELVSEGGKEILKKGETVLIPAETTSIALHAEHAALLEVYI